MELGLEGILETILVGSIASLFLLSVLFLAFGHVLRVDPIRRIAQFALYEQRFVKDDKPLESHESHDKHMSFAFLLLIALLYGLGATVESITHDIPLYRDKIIKAEAFEKVGRGQVEGQTASPGFARFVTDDLACRAAQIAPDAHDENSPCQEIYRREREFYYSAKNAVFQNEAFAKELSVLQARIDFVRSACISLGLLALATLAATILAGVFEWLVKDSGSGATDAWRALSAPKTISQHWKEFAAVRCLLITGLLGGLFFVSYIAWKKVETQYDRRVFGYYLSLHDARPGEAEPGHQSQHDERGGGGGEEAHSGKALVESSPSPLPSSPYRVFSAPRGEPFEPSAIHALDGASRFLVSNDQRGGHPFLLFNRDPNGLGQPSVVDEGGLEAFRSKRHVKIETLIAPLPADDSKTDVQVLAVGDRSTHSPGLPVFKVTFSAGAGQPTVAASTSLPVPCDLVKTDRPDVQSCTIEGAVMRVGKGGKKWFLLGVRYLLGPGRNNHTPTVAIIGVPATEAAPAEMKPTVIMPPTRLPGPLAECAGISDLQVLDDDSLLMLTSVEMQGTTGPCGEKGLLPIAQVQGALWHVKQRGEAPTTGSPMLLQRFVHKPEGLTLLRDGTVLVVFDDDGPRKSLSRAPQTFPLEQHQSVYTIVSIDKARLAE